MVRGWLDKTVIYHKCSFPGSHISDSRDFSGSSVAMAVISYNSDAEIRNTILSVHVCFKTYGHSSATR